MAEIVFVDDMGERTGWSMKEAGDNRRELLRHGSLVAVVERDLKKGDWVLVFDGVQYAHGTHDALCQLCRKIAYVATAHTMASS